MPKLDHINLHTRAPAELIAFLEAVAEAHEGFRPPFGNRGHWLYLDGEPAIHIDVVARDDPFPKGMVDHVAFGVYERAPLMERIEASGYPYVLAGIPGTAIGQVFVTGPEGLKVELQFRRAATE